MTHKMPGRGLVPLPAETPSLARVLPTWQGSPFPAQTLFALGPEGGYAVLPTEGMHIDFGRGPDRHLLVGRDDNLVSRMQGLLRRTDDRWWLTNAGRAAVRVPDEGEPLLTGHEVVVEHTYVPAYVLGRTSHVIELAVNPAAPRRSPVTPDEITTPRPSWPLRERERLVLTVVFERYLLRSDDPRPVSAADAARTLMRITGDSTWNAHRVANVVDAVRKRLARHGEPGLQLEDAPPEKLKVNLYRRLAVESATLTPKDLRLLPT